MAKDESSREAKEDKDLFAAIGKQVLGLNLNDGDQNDQQEDEPVKIVDVIESYCVNCEENACTSNRLPSLLVLTLLGYNSIIAH